MALIYGLLALVRPAGQISQRETSFYPMACLDPSPQTSYANDHNQEVGLA